MDAVLKEKVHDAVYRVEPVTVGAKAGYRFVKRAFDFVVSLVLLVLLAVPMVLLGILISLDSPGPAIYRQERLGLNGRSFYIYKFRTMVQDAERDGPQWAKENDIRCTRLGKLLRKCRVDELPQLINVLKNDMSLVGPRPERAYFYQEFETYIHGFSERLKVKPGITGWAQVNGGYTLRPEEKIVYDVEYIKKQSVKMDLKCMLMTFRVVFTHHGAR